MKRTIAVSVAAIILSALALACSGSHHSSDDPGTTPVRLWGEGNSSFGTWTCQDACACQPPQDFRVVSWQDVKANDLCGTQLSCRYRCSADCSKP